MTELSSPILEASLLGASLLAPAVTERLVLDFDLEPAHFTEPLHRTAWHAIRSTWQDTGSVDLAAIATRLPDGTPIEAIDGLAATACAPESVRDVANRVIRLSTRRAWRDAAYELLRASEEDSERHVELAQTMLRAEQGIDSDLWTRERMQSDVFDWLGSDAAVGITTGLPVVDDAIGGGLRPGDVTALGGWTGQGKSVLLDDMLMAAVAAGRTAHLFINEMSPRDRALRLIAKQGAAPYPRLVVRDLEPSELSSVLDAASKLPFDITECSSWPVEKIARSIRVNAWDVVALDVLHNLPFKDTRELDEAVSILLAAARQSGSHLILVCHLNDERAKTQLLPVPVVRDIRNSGMIARASANVLMLHREQINDRGFVVTQSEATVDVLKARHGRPAAVAVRLDVHRLRFSSWRDAA